jgi:hypothetical protein
MKSKRQTTRGKLAHERPIYERRALKREKKQAAAAAGGRFRHLRRCAHPETAESRSRVSASRARQLVAGQ